MTEHRFDFRGGRNTSVSPDLLNPTELTDSTNARLDQIGGILKRTGSRRMHATAIGTGNPVKGVTQWDSPSGRQIVAICNGRLYHKLTDFGEFTEIIPGTLFSTTRFAHFMPFRASSSGAPLVLFIASGGNYYKFDGTTLTLLTGISAAPQTELLTPYSTRGFTVDQRFRKTLFWSRVGDAEVFTTSVGTDGGSAIVDVLTGDVINYLDVIGSSLLIATEDAIARFTGLDTSDIVIEQATAGISAEVGVVGEVAGTRVEQVIAFMSDRGPYFATEAGVSAIGVDVEPDFDALDRTMLDKITVGHHRQRREIWFAQNATAYVYNYRVQNWCGPFTYPFNITTFSRFEDSTGAEWLIAGCSDGRVRHMDSGTKDDVLADASGGSNYTMTIQLAPFFFDTGPAVVKALRGLVLQADLPVPTAVQVSAAFDSGAFISLLPATITGIANGTQSYRLDAPSTLQGKRMKLKITDASADIPIINGLSADAFDMRRY